ncbi:hypothetical protein SCLCIDRAFT_199825 [Scleroderma citrinum Foug A]|uniref:Uncharacterized protein n=1 Tax=Scleroderma citrinum Foug A TaxID=1036808 RepID=A0A0C3D842_9AGAM|nr:hypothetical protein SCLCIDRAFT_199825 [Scleroderma citrinum Foug A]
MLLLAGSPRDNTHELSHMRGHDASLLGLYGTCYDEGTASLDDVLNVGSTEKWNSRRSQSCQLVDIAIWSRGKVTCHGSCHPTKVNSRCRGEYDSFFVVTYCHCP